MQTLDEVLREHARQQTERDAAKAAYKADMLTWLDDIEAAGIPLREGVTAERREQTRRLIRAGSARRLDIACPLCGTQLVIPRPHKFMAMMPPRQGVDCPGCGFAKTVLVSVLMHHSA